MTKRNFQKIEYDQEQLEKQFIDEKITTNISLTKEQWESIIYHVKNDSEFARLGLMAQAPDLVKRIVNNASAILKEIKDKTGLEYHNNG